MAEKSERRFILEMIENGKITAEDGIRLLQALPDDEQGLETEAGSEALSSLAPPPVPDEMSVSKEVEGSVTLADSKLDSSESRLAEEETEDADAAGYTEQNQKGEAAQTPGIPLPPDIEKWRRWWMIPLWVGVGFTVLGGWLMYLDLRTSDIGFWFFCAWVPLLFGLAAMTLSWQSRTARWLHLRIYQKSGEWPQKIAISFPLPIRLTAWILRVFGDKIPGLSNTSVDELILALGESATPENPLYVEVDEGEDGERVQIYIG